jgi:hypothetical protein
MAKNGAPTSLIVRRITWIRAAGLAVTLVLAVGLNVATAAPVTYSFSTGANPFASSFPYLSPLAGVFSTGDFVSGTFTYDAAAPVSFPGPAGSTIYDAASGGFTALSGSVAGLNFSDISGVISVGNDLPISGFPAADNIVLHASDSPDVRNITGFSISGFTLVDVRMFWIEGLLGITDFLTDQSLPLELPAFEGRLALDFRPTDNLSGPVTDFVFFDGLHVQPLAAPVPAPASLLLFAPGLAGLAAVRRRFKK